MQLLLISIKWKCGVLTHSKPIKWVKSSLHFTRCSKLVPHFCLFSTDLSWPNVKIYRSELSGGELLSPLVQFGFRFLHCSASVYLRQEHVSQDDFVVGLEFFLFLTAFHIHSSYSVFKVVFLKRKCFFYFQAHLLLVIPYGLAIHHHPIKKIGSVLQIPHQPVLF